MGNTATTPAGTKPAAPETPSSEEAPTDQPFFKRKFSPDHVLAAAYVVLCALIILKSVVVIGVTAGSAVRLRQLSWEQSGRLVALVALAVLAAVVLSICIYALVAVLRKHYRAVQVASVTLVVLAIVQAVVVGVSVPVTIEDEIHLAQSLSESFRQAKIDTRNAKTWANIQSTLYCCGVRTPEDYRLLGVAKFFPPHVPISCCPSYDSSRSELVQEREKEGCRARREFYQVGCTSGVLLTYRNSAHLVLVASILFIILIVTHSTIGAVLAHRKTRNTLKSNVERTLDSDITPQAVVSQKPRAKLSLT